MRGRGGGVIRRSGMRMILCESGGEVRVLGGERALDGSKEVD